MGSLMKTSISGSIHRIREFELEKVHFIYIYVWEFDVIKIKI